MNYSSLALLALAIGLLIFFQKFLSSRQHQHLSFPPGPLAFPLIGNLRDLPTKLPWLTYADWGAQYGSDVVHTSALGQHIVVVNSIEAAVELFEKRAHIYSGRPVIPMIELIGWDFNFGFMPMGDRLTAAIIMVTVYGYEVQSSNDRFVALSENAAKKLSDSSFPGAVAVNTFPILRYLPSWMPGAGFQRFAAGKQTTYGYNLHLLTDLNDSECRRVTKEMREVPFEYVKQNMRDGLDSKSVVARLLEANQVRGRHDEVAIQDVAATAYGAGADTSVSALASFFFAMAVHPDIQKKAQTEIDTVIGTHRLPRFEDRPSLPYVEALYREVMRWKPVGPLGIAHASTADDVYNGYFIPKGAIVIGNIWAMTRQESIYPNPERFNPDRFFTADSKLIDDTILAFGFGRRICVGRHNADATIWGTIASILSTFNIEKAKDATGKEIDIDPNYSDGMISHPGPFACSITPRSEATKSLVQAMTETEGL
ncbi:O-methylsterigmatocystin oxidoreductase [Mycena sanguinolenta]|uniref:O-methylsterigmatocystin oxidoreductase n=1 Tax=Mycena sanguinolenta TaxID=230812 RepID=A0A8H7CQG1_9AGAR|nr:O-methylsterigmatocystin oxidoreductase [Mycena sanguinolenta]